MNPNQPPAPPPNPKLCDLTSTSTADLAALLSQRRKPNRPKQPASAVTKAKLIKLAGNSKVAQRLADTLMANHPDRSEQWAWEKAIYDLERDRHV
jgi:hypothetical protein